MTHKYRPYFTLAELKELHSDNTSLSIYLRRFIEDIEQGNRKVNHISKPSMAQKLEFELPDIDVSIAQLLKLFAESGTANMREKQIEKVQQHRYENDMMDKEEEKEWEKLQGCR